MSDLTTVQKGDASEAYVISQFKKMGCPILLPWGDNQKYDIAVDIGNGNIERIQIKRMWYSENSAIKLQTHSRHTNRKKNKIKRYESSEIDSFVGHIPDTNELVYVPIEDAPDNTMSFRHRYESNVPTINWVDEHLLKDNFDK